MNEAPAKEKQQVIDKIKSSTNIMVTVSRNPSVDDLSAALGLTAMLNKIGKHATAIFSGAVPPAITFLEPDKVFENTIDSLRDFIIALDKEKADHLRYKVEGDVVKIFITPYRTVISSNDLEFSQGDYNVELVLALGVENQEHLDAALSAHGQILHDVTVATLSAGATASHLGAIDWAEPNASCLSEMITILSDSLKTDAPLLDKQIATALLTGIVAATDRFSNIKTSSGVMTLAAQLMAAGADQQLIASKLQESHQINSLSTQPSIVSASPEPLQSDVQTSTLPPDTLAISHEDTTVAPPVIVAPPVSAPVEPAIAPIQPSNLDVTSTLPPSDEPRIVLDSQSHILPDSSSSTLPKPESSTISPQTSDQPVANPEFTPESDMLMHSYLGGTNPSTAASNDNTKAEDSKLIDIFNNDTAIEPAADLLPGVNNQSTVGSSRDADEARAAVDSVISSQPQTVVTPPVMDLPLPPPVPDFSSTLPPTVPNIGSAVGTDAISSVNNDPTQFKIPGQ